MARNFRKSNNRSYHKSRIGEPPVKRTVKTKIKITGKTNREAVNETMQKTKSNIAQEILG